MSFVKLDSGILDSSLWMEPAEICKVFITVLAMTDSEGMCRATAPGIARRACLKLVTVRAALDRLESPDPESRSLEEEGRRLVRIDGGYKVVNYLKYRQKDHTAPQRMKRYRDRNKRNVTRNGRNATAKTVTVTQAEAEAEVEAEAEKKQKRTTEGAAAAPPLAVAHGWGQEFTDDYREVYKADPTDATRKHVKGVAQRYGWGKTRPILQAYMRATPIEFLNVPKALPVWIEGGHSLQGGNGTSLVRAGPQRQTAAEDTAAAAMRYLKRHEGEA